MPQWDSKQFDERATKIAHAFHAGRGELHALTVKQAKDAGLNEEQIRRLGRAVNVKAFEQKFAALKGKADRVVEFDPVDAERVIEDLGVSVATKTAEARYPELPDEMRPVRTGPLLTKTAHVDIDAELQASLPRDPPIERQINHWRAVEEELRTKIAGAQIRWTAAMDELYAHSRRIYWERDAFEKDAIALYGPEALPELNALRAEANLGPVPTDEETATKLASELFGEVSEDTRLLKTALDARDLYVRAGKALENANTKVSELRKMVLG